MRFIVDECTGSAVARWLQAEGHDVYSVYEEARGLADVEILHKAHQETRILITNDKDFGERIFRNGSAHRGIILLRLQDERAASKINALRRLLATYAEELLNRFVVVTETTVRFAGQ